MKLAGTPSLLRRLEQIESQHTHDDRLDHRKWARVSVRAEAELHPVDRSRFDRTPVDIAIRDVSLGGIGFVSSQPLAENTLWRCCFLKQGHIAGQQTVIIRHCAPVEEGIYLVGAQVALDTAILSMLDAPPTP